MSVLLNDGNFEYLWHANAVLVSVPLTMACFFRINDNTVHSTLISLCDSAGDVNYFSLRALGVGAGIPLEIAATTRSNVGPAVAYSDSQYTANQWHHAAFVSATAGSRYAYLDGVPGARNASNKIPFGIDITGIGALLRNGLTGYTSGDIAEVGIWHEPLTTQEIAALASGVSPPLVRPEHLAACWALLKADPANKWNSRFGQYQLSENGAPVGNVHPTPLYGPMSPRVLVPTTRIARGKLSSSPRTIGKLTSIPQTTGILNSKPQTVGKLAN